MRRKSYNIREDFFRNFYLFLLSFQDLDRYISTPLHGASYNSHLEIVKVLIAYGANYDYKNKYGKTPVDVANNDITKTFILKEIRWSRRRSLILTKPYDDHETNEEHQLTPLGNIITAIKSNNDPSSQDGVLYQLKMKISSFL